MTANTAMYVVVCHFVPQEVVALVSGLYSANPRPCAIYNYYSACYYDSSGSPISGGGGVLFRGPGQSGGRELQRRQSQLELLNLLPSNCHYYWSPPPLHTLHTTVYEDV